MADEPATLNPPFGDLDYTLRIEVRHRGKDVAWAISEKQRPMGGTLQMEGFNGAVGFCDFLRNVALEIQQTIVKVEPS